MKKKKTETETETETPIPSPTHDHVSMAGLQKDLSTAMQDVFGPPAPLLEEVLSRAMDRSMARVEVCKQVRGVSVDAMKDHMLDYYARGFSAGVALAKGDLSEEDINRSILSLMGLESVWSQLSQMGVTIDVERWDGWWERNRTQRSMPSMSYTLPTTKVGWGENKETK